MSNNLATTPKREVTLADRTAHRITEMLQNGQLHLPADYSADNELKAAWLALQTIETKDKKPVLQACTQSSIANALLSMVVQGLSVDKQSCYFIPYGEHLACQRSYFGDILLAKRQAGVLDVLPMVVYEGEEFNYSVQGGRIVVDKHVPDLDRKADAPIKFAYCVVEFSDGRSPYTEVMTWAQVQSSWEKAKGRQNNQYGPHKQTPDRMTIRTVIRRALKRYINSSMAPDLRMELERIESTDQMAAAQADLDVEVESHTNREHLPLPEADQRIDVETGEVLDAEFDAAHAEHVAAQEPMLDPGY